MTRVGLGDEREACSLSSNRTHIVSTNPPFPHPMASFRHSSGAQHLDLSFPATSPSASKRKLFLSQKPVVGDDHPSCPSPVSIRLEGIPTGRGIHGRQRSGRATCSVSCLLATTLDSGRRGLCTCTSRDGRNEADMGKRQSEGRALQLCQPARAALPLALRGG